MAHAVYFALLGSRRFCCSHPVARLRLSQVPRHAVPRLVPRDKLHPADAYAAKAKQFWHMDECDAKAWSSQLVVLRSSRERDWALDSSSIACVTRHVNCLSQVLAWCVHFHIAWAICHWLSCLLSDEGVGPSSPALTIAQVRLIFSLSNGLAFDLKYHVRSHVMVHTASHVQFRTGSTGSNTCFPLFNAVLWRISSTSAVSTSPCAA